MQIHKSQLTILIFLAFLFLNIMPVKAHGDEDHNVASDTTINPETTEIIEPFAEIPDSTTEQPEIEYFRARVIEVLEDGERELMDERQPFQRLKLKIISGREKGTEIEAEYGDLFTITENQKLRAGDAVVLSKFMGPEGLSYFVTDQYRLSPILIISIFFFALAVLFGRLKGFTSILGLALSLTILVKFIVPKIVDGESPLLISLAGAFVIAFLSLYLAHGFNRRTSIALLGTLITLGIAAGLSIIFVSAAKLFGTGTEEAYYLGTTQLAGINLRGLLLGGIIIGALGVLDDITTGQAAAVHEIHNANPSLSFLELYRRGISVGKEHIASLVNTLVLAYAGAAFPLFLLFYIQKETPFWVVLNGEFLAEEIIRTLVGSSALIFAVPITTLLAAWFLAKAGQKQKNV